MPLAILDGSQTGLRHNMTTVLLIVQLMISIVLIGLILVQRSEGGALGIGGGGGGVMSGRSSASAITKATTIIGTLFMLNCLALSAFFAIENRGSVFSVEDNAEQGLIIIEDSANDTSPLVDDSLNASAAEENPSSDDGQPAPQEGSRE